MNKKIILIAFVFFTLISCDENEDREANYVIPDYVSGTWEFSQIGSLNSTNTIIYQDYLNEAICDSDNIVINADKTFDFNDFIITNGVCSEASYSGTYTLKNSTITTKYINSLNEELTIVYTIVSLNQTEMVLSTSTADSGITFYKLERK